jgi:hypothetical protein
VTQYRTLVGCFGTVQPSWPRRNTAMSERKPDPPHGARVPPRETPRAPERPLSAREVAARRGVNKFAAATDGWDAYNDWLGRVRQPAPPSRQAVISKSLYSIASYKNWADKARDAFDKAK